MSSNVNRENEFTPMEAIDNPTVSSTIKLNEKGFRGKDQFTEVQSPYNTNRECEFTATSMKAADDPMLSSSAQSDELQVSVMEGTSKEVCSNSAGTNTELDVTTEKDCIVLRFSFAATPESVPTVDNPSKEVHPSSYNNETEVTPICHSTSVFEVSEPVSKIKSEEMSVSEEGKPSATVNKTVLEDLDDPMSTADRPVSKIEGLSKSLSSVNRETVATSDEQMPVVMEDECSPNQSQSAIVNKANVIVDIPFSTIKELTAKLQLSYEGTNKKIHDSSTTAFEGQVSVSKGNGTITLGQPPSLAGKNKTADDEEKATDASVASALNRKRKASLTSGDFEQPPSKKIFLDTGMRIVVKDILSDVHTSLCKSNCTILQHSPLFLAVSAPDDFKLKACLGRYLKQAINRSWKGTRNITHLGHPLLHMTMLLGKCDILEFLFKAVFSHSEAARTRSSPLHAVFKQIQHYMPTSSCDKKVMAFRGMLQILVKYNHSVVQLVDCSSGNSTLHTCASKIRSLSKQIKATLSLDESLAELQRLLELRALMDKLFSEMVQIFRELSAKGPWFQEQVTKLFDCKNKAGETISTILKEDESVRQSCNDVVYKTKLIVSEEENMSVAHANQPISFDDEHYKDKMNSRETSQSTTQAKVPSRIVAILPNCVPAQSTDDRPGQFPSTTDSASAYSTQTEPSSQTVNVSETEAMPLNYPSAKSADVHPEQSPPITVSTDSASACSTQTELSSETVNLSETEAMPRNYPSAKSADVHPEQSPPITVSTDSASACSTQTELSSQTVNLSESEAMPLNYPSAKSADVCPEQSPPITVSTDSASACSTQTEPSSQTVNLSESEAMPLNYQSAKSADVCPEQSPPVTVSTTAAASVSLPQSSCTVTTAGTSYVAVHLPKGCAREYKSIPVFVSTCSARTTLSSKDVNESGTGDSSSSSSSVQSLSSNLPTIQVKTVPLKRTHTFLCVPYCDLKHHELIRLLCATPDHHSTDTLTTETESCEKLRNYLEETAWSLDSIVHDYMPSLRYPITHLACLLGKYKALEVLSEFGFRPLSTTAITDETPLHMVVRLLRHEWSGSIFLCDAVISIINTLSRRIQDMFLLSAKDCRGNTVLHLMAETIGSPNVPVAVTLLFVYLFRVFVHFQLKGQIASVQHWSLSNSLTNCNDTGQNVEFLLKRNCYGEQLLTYLRKFLTQTEPSEVSKGQSATTEKTLGQKDTRQVVFAISSLQNASSVTMENCKSSSHPENCVVTNVHIKQECAEPVAQVDVHLDREAEPGSLVDFVLSAECGIDDLAKRQIVHLYLTEYETRLKFLTAKITRLKKSSKPPTGDSKLVEHKTLVKTLQRESSLIRLSIERDTGKMREVINERNRQRREHSILDQRISKLEKLAEVLQQLE